MLSLILPCAGKSTRFGFTKPKWALTHPSGRLMIEEAVAGIDMTNVDCIYIAFLKQHLTKMQVDLSELVSGLQLPHVKVRGLVLDDSDSQVQTVHKVIEHFKITGAIAIKDCDNFFTWNPDPKNAVATMKLTKNSDVRFLQQKSFIQEHPFAIVEKKIISELFCVGGYTFESAADFTHHAYQCDYISEVISALNKPFELDYVIDYLDWGSRQSWMDYKSQFKTLFVDIDGVLFENGSQFFNTRWADTDPIEKNIAALNAKNAYVVLTTARPERLRSITEKQLKNAKVKYKQLVMGLPATKRCIINDYNDESSPYPTAFSLNIQRNSDNLAEILSGI